MRDPIHPSSVESPPAPAAAGGNGKPSPKCGISVGWGNNNNNEGDLSGDDDEVEVVLHSSREFVQMSRFVVKLFCNLQILQKRQMSILE